MHWQNIQACNPPPPPINCRCVKGYSLQIFFLINTPHNPTSLFTLFLQHTTSKFFRIWSGGGFSSHNDFGVRFLMNQSLPVLNFFFFFFSGDQLAHTNSTPSAKVSPQWLSELWQISLNLPPALLTERLGSFMCHCANMGVEQTPNKSQHWELSLEKKISWHSYQDSNSQIFNHKPGALSTELSQPQIMK